MSFGGFYTRQEQEDVLASRIDNPNRVGSGFINLGPQTRNMSAPMANWQTASLVGGAGGGAAPPNVSDIWASTPQAQPRSQQNQKPLQMPQMPVPPAPVSQAQAFASKPGMPGGGAFSQARPSDPTAGVNGLFGSFSIDPATQARAGQTGRAPVSAAPPPAFPGIPNSIPRPPNGAGVQQPFLNGNAAPQSQPTSSLMSMLNTTPQPPAPSLNPAFAGGLSNGSVPNASARHQAAFAPMPPVPQCQASSFGAAPPNAFGGAPSSHRGGAPQQPPAPARAVPKTLSSAADYGAAAAAWKPPTASTASGTSAVSVSRKPEAASARGSGQTTESARTTESVAEWECRRCTFLNNGSLWECEMCGFERPGKTEQQAAAKEAATSHRSNANSEDAGWQTASKTRSTSSHAAGQQQGGAAGKSKAQAKNEKRRAKKRADGSLE